MAAESNGSQTRGSSVLVCRQWIGPRKQKFLGWDPGSRVTACVQAPTRVVMWLCGAVLGARRRALRFGCGSIGVILGHPKVGDEIAHLSLPMGRARAVVLFLLELRFGYGVR